MKAILSLMLAMALITGVFAVGMPHPRMDTDNTILGCRIVQTTEGIEEIVDKVPEADDLLSDHVDILIDDKDQLDAFAEDDDWRGFAAYRIATYRPHQIDANRDIWASFRSFKDWNVSKDTIAEMRNTSKALKDTFMDCKKAALKDFADDKSLKYTEGLQEKQEMLDQMKENNPDIDTEGMQEVLDDASDFIDEYDAAVADAETDRELFMAIRGYCAYNGCPAGKNFHFAANLGLAKQEATLALISPDAIDAGHEDLVEEAQEYLDAASEALDEVGTDNYTFETRADVWDNLREANKKIREIVQALKGE